MDNPKPHEGRDTKADHAVPESEAVPESKVDATLDDSFPASDPPAFSGITGDVAAQKIEDADEPSESQIDETLEDSFPASDPPSYTGITGTGN